MIDTFYAPINLSEPLSLTPSVFITFVNKILSNSEVEKLSPILMFFFLMNYYVLFAKYIFHL